MPSRVPTRAGQPGRFADLVVWRANPLAITGPDGLTLDALGRMSEGTDDAARLATVNAFITKLAQDARGGGRPSIRQIGRTHPLRHPSGEMPQSGSNVCRIAHLNGRDPMPESAGCCGTKVALGRSERDVAAVTALGMAMRCSIYDQLQVGQRGSV